MTWGTISKGHLTREVENHRSKVKMQFLSPKSLPFLPVTLQLAQLKPWAYQDYQGEEMVCSLLSLSVLLLIRAALELPFWKETSVCHTELVVEPDLLFCVFRYSGPHSCSPFDLARIKGNKSNPNWERGSEMVSVCLWHDLTGRNPEDATESW